MPNQHPEEAAPIAKQNEDDPDTLAIEKGIEDPSSKKRKPEFKIEKLEERELPDDISLHSTNNQI